MSDSYDFHMSTATRAISSGTHTVEAKRIEFYGRPSDAVLEQLSSMFDVGEEVGEWVEPDRMVLIPLPSRCLA